MSINLSPKALAVALVASLCFNLAAIGFLIGRMAHWEDREMLVTPQTAALQALPADRVRELVRTHSETIVPVQQHMTYLRRVRSDLHRLLMTEPFNHRAFETKLEELSAGVARVHGHTNSSLVKITMQLTPTERRMVANMIERPRFDIAPTRIWIGRDMGAFDPARPTPEELRRAASNEDR